MLGAGAVPSDIIASAATVAAEWAGEIGYPGPDRYDLAAVAQYQSSGLGDPPAVGEYLGRSFRTKLEQVTGLSVSDKLHPLRFLTGHPLPTFITTNYDDMIERSLRVNDKTPQPMSCAWRDRQTMTEPPVAVDVDTPLVFHLHGRWEDPESMVVTKADYLDFVLALGDRKLLPGAVTDAMINHSLLFVGYSFRDSNFHLILRAIRPRRANVAVLHPPSGLDDAHLERWMDYFPRYLQSLTGCVFDIFWGSGQEFCAELRRRLEVRR